MSSIMSQELSFAKSRQRKIAEILSFVAQCQQQGKRLDEVERGLWSHLRELGWTLLQEFIEAAGDGDRGKTVVRRGRLLRRSCKKHERFYRSTFGAHRIERFVYAVRERQKVEAAPLDEQLGLPAGQQSYVLEDWVGRLAADVPYEKAVRWLEEIWEIRTHVRTAETMVAKLSEYVEGFRDQRPALPQPTGQELLVVTADGKGAPIRRPLEQRLADELGRKPHKRHSITPYQKAEKRRCRGDKKVRKQMVSVAALYRIEPWRRTASQFLQEEEGSQRPRPQDKRLFAEMTEIQDGEVSRGSERLFAQLRQEIAACLRGRPLPLICLMDGDRSLWVLMKQYLPEAIGILDIYHVCEKLWIAAHCFHPEGSADAEQFASRYLEMLLEGKVHCVIGVFRRWLKQKPLSSAKRKLLHEVVNYFHRYRSAMRYDEYLKAGYPIGSGVAEGACRHIVADRLEQTGMRWEIEGAQSILDVRTTSLNGEWSAFIQHRIQTEQTALYGCAA